MPVPSIGRIVHFVAENGEHLPAIVVKPHGDMCATLSVFGDPEHAALARSNVTLNEDTKLPGSFHFPEFVPEPKRGEKLVKGVLVVELPPPVLATDTPAVKS